MQKRIGWLVAGVVAAAMWAQSSIAQQRIIYDDDCSQDVDCVATLPILFQLEQRGEIQVLGMVADSTDPYSAPVFRAFARRAGRSEVPIGANQTQEPSTALCAQEKCNESGWAEKLVGRFDAGDTRAKYPGCVEVYRKALAGQPDRSVAIVETGFATCLEQLLASPADSVSPLSGEELVKRKAKLLSIMGGKYPAGVEWNFKCDAPDYHALFLKWTRQNGYPPIYLNGFDNGLHVMAGAPASASPETNPTVYGMQLAGVKQRPMWDMLSVLFAARGPAYEWTPYFIISNPGTLTVDATTGADTWSDTIDSGQFVLTNAASDETFTALFDGYAHQGFLAHTGKPDNGH